MKKELQRINIYEYANYLPIHIVEKKVILQKRKCLGSFVLFWATDHDKF